jgi:hypothetical protein
MKKTDIHVAAMTAAKQTGIVQKDKHDKHATIEEAQGPFRHVQG